MRVLLLVALAWASKECEVCIATIEKIDGLVDADEKKSVQSIIEAVEKHCGDLQNEKPNPALGPRDLKMCYYLLPIKMAVAEAMAMRMPKERVCKKLKQKNDDICAVKYPIKLDQNPEEFKKMRIKELRAILKDRGVDYANFVEKDEYVAAVIASMHLEL